MDERSIRDFIEAGKESRQLEYKQSVSWDEASIRMNIIKTILGMANTPDGGTIVIGMERQDDNLYIPKGTIEDHEKTFQNEDNMKDVVSNYADPYIEFDVGIYEYEEKNFVVFSISEFSELPVICKREYPDILRRGALYIRSKRKPETIEVPSQVEMRELLELATDKGILRLAKRGYQVKETMGDEAQYEQQLEDFK